MNMNCVTRYEMLNLGTICMSLFLRWFCPVPCPNDSDIMSSLVAFVNSYGRRMTCTVTAEDYVVEC